MIKLTGATAGQIIAPNVFYSSTGTAFGYAAYDSGGFVRAYNYSSDANALIVGSGGTFSGSTSSSNIEVTGTPAGIASATLNTFSISAGPSISSGAPAIP